MKYDKYGDLLYTENQKADLKTLRAFLIVTLLQAVFICINLLVIFIEGLNSYLSFVTAPGYIFLYINFLKAYEHHGDSGRLPSYLKAVKILSPILYGITAVIVIFTGF
ncbi:MAG: hypothetical protein ACOYJS_06580 [Acutalibacteraceae bacterium]|jgi:phosphoglycerol transferase MdoB-like AlkP superfamily enzyme